MNILSPVDSAKEAELLIKAGATELFCGYIPKSWSEKYQVIEGEHVQSKKKAELLSVSLNKRNNIEGNITDCDELVNILKIANENNVKVYITLNAFYYTEHEYDYIKNYIQELLDLGVYGFIVTDVALISFIHEYFPQAVIVLSCCNQVANSACAKFFGDLGVKRITFPRHVTLDEILNIASNVPELEYECFVLDSRCVYDDGNCRAMHNFGHFCMEQWDLEYFDCTGKKDISYQEIEDIRQNEIDFTKWSKPYLSLNARNHGWYAISCCACAIPYLLKQGNLKSLKIAGRGLDTTSKIMMVRAVTKMLSIANNSENPVKDEKDYICKLVGVPELCENQTRCLFASKHYQ